MIITIFLIIGGVFDVMEMMMMDCDADIIDTRLRNVFDDRC